MKKYYRLYMVAAFGFLAFLGLGSVLSSQKEYSEHENRYLEKYPPISLERILSGDFQKSFEKAFGDQFVCRDEWMQTSTAVQKNIGYQEVSSVYFGKDGYYFAKKTQEMMDQKQYSKNLHYVEYLGTKMQGKTQLLLVPSPATVLSDKLPKQAPYYDADAMYRMADTLLKSTRNVDVRPILNRYKSKGQIYYKTDHHWTLFGAYAAYRTLCEELHINAQSYKSFEPKAVATDFYGTMYSKVLDEKAVPDTLYAAQNIPEVATESDGQKGQGIYDVRKLVQKDKYAYFFGGNYGEVRITSKKGEASAGKKLLVIKDSFANSFIPFLLSEYNEITMIDLRYYRDSIQTLLDDEEYDHVLVLYEMSNFAEEGNLYKLVR